MPACTRSSIILFHLTLIINIIYTVVIIKENINRWQMPACTRDTKQLLLIMLLLMASIPGLLCFNLKMKKDEDTRNSPSSESQLKIKILLWLGLLTAPR